MTYCVGLRREDGVFLFADTALTAGEDMDFAPTTIFGELTKTDGPFVSERMVKTWKVQNCGLAIAGDWKVASRIISRFKSQQIATVESVRQMIRSERRASRIKLIYGIWEQGKPILEAWNLDGCQEFERDQIGFAIGSMPRYLMEDASGYLKTLNFLSLESVGIECKGIDALLLGYLQKLGMHRYLLDHSVGGAFTSVWIDSVAANHQPDLLFAIHSSGEVQRCIIACARDDTTVLIAPDDRRVIGWTLQNESSEMSRQRMTDVLRRVENEIHTQPIEYIVFLDIASPRVVVADTNSDFVSYSFQHDGFQVQFSIGQVFEKYDGSPADAPELMFVGPDNRGFTINPRSVAK